MTDGLQNIPAAWFFGQPECFEIVVLDYQTRGPIVDWNSIRMCQILAVNDNLGL